MVSPRLSAVAFLAIVVTACSAEQPVAPAPQDDYYAHVNADWLASATIPEEVPWISPFVVNALAAQDEVRGVVEDAAAADAAPGTPERLVGDFHRSVMDTAVVETAGLGPLADVLAMIDALDGPDDLALTFGRLAAEHADPDPNSLFPRVTPLALSVWTDRLDAQRAALVLRPAGLGLPDRAYYLQDEYAEVRSAYRDHVIHLLALSGQDEPDRAAEAVLAIETALAGARMSEAALHDAEGTWHPMTRDALAERFAGLDWDALLAAAGVSAERDVVVTEPGYLLALSDMVSARSSADWRAYLRWQVVRRYAPFLPEAYQEADFAFYGRVLMGNERPRPRPERAGLAAEGAFPDLVGRLWTERHVHPDTKTDVRALVEAVRDAFAARIALSDRFEPGTKAAALEKLAALRIDVAYPDDWSDVPSVEIRPDELIGNLRRLSAAAFRADLARLDAPIDRARWYDAPYSTNAYYVRGTNTLAIPAGNLRAPYYDPAATLAENLGGIGTVIGHEMGHAFDDQGARFDGSGELREWWTSEDAEAFETQVATLVRQYETYEALPGLPLDGRLVVSEAFADLTGLTVAHDALTTELAGVGDEERTAATRAYLVAFCRHWRAKYREPLLRRIVASDGHPPQRFRCNGPLAAFAPFYDAYDVRLGDGMYLPPAERAEVW